MEEVPLQGPAVILEGGCCLAIAVQGYLAHKKTPTALGVVRLVAGDYSRVNLSCSAAQSLSFENTVTDCAK